VWSVALTIEAQLKGLVQKPDLKSYTWYASTMI